MSEGQLDFRQLFEESPDVLLVLLPDAPRYTMVAATRARLLATGTTREQTLGKGLFEVFPDNPDDPSATGTSNLRASLERVLKTRAADTMAVQKYDIRGPDGIFVVKHWSPKNVPVLSPSGEVLYIFHRVEDVTELVRTSELGDELRDHNSKMRGEVIARSRELAEANRELREANSKLGELDAAKTAFFSNVSHELRTPLMLILGPVEDCLADPALSRPHGDTLRLVHSNALRLLKLVNALLDFAQLEAGRMRVRYAPADLSALTARLAGMFASAVEKGGVRLVVDAPPLSQPAWVDRELWEKIVPNLVSNAFKYTREGEIAVRLREEPATFVLEVADTGVGISPADLPRIFERFYRAPAAQGRTFEGAGIGLSLVQELVELHGGRVGVDSTVGKGTTFRVEIPKGFSHLPADAVSQVPVEEGSPRAAVAYAVEASHWQGAAGPAPAAAPADRGGAAGRARVLVVDDNADLRQYVSSLLAPFYEVTTAVDGVAALEAVEAARPDIVVSDVMMPRLDGLGLVRRLRAAAATSSLPVILLSARAGEDSAVDGLGSGADDYLIKPFSARELLARVRTHVDLARTRQEWISELQQANRELDAFSYSVSHDLRAPLRVIDGFSRALADDCASALGAQGLGHLERIRGGVQRMGALIDALLELARISRSPLRLGPVDLTAMAHAVVADLRQAHPHRKVEVHIDEGLRAHGDRMLLNVVLVNLIGNAWKFTSATEDAGIEVRRVDAAQPTFMVRDRGAGFDMAYASKLFAPFQRLHRAEEFEGTGIGLATVQRIVTRHGGRIWAEAAVGTGATFFWSLPEPVEPSSAKQG